MESRHLGKTSLPVFRLGLGLAALGRPGYINLGHADDLQGEYDGIAMEAHCHAVLDVAWEFGIRYFDAARSYGRSEEFLASWLASRGIRPDEITIGSKWGYTYTADWKVNAEKHEVKDHSLVVLTRQVMESRGWLGDHLDLYQIHSATLESGVLTDAAVLEKLSRLRADGMRIGLTLTGPKQAETLRRAMDIQAGDNRLFDCVQATWNLLEPSAGNALQTASKLGMGVIVKEALANGRLTARNTDSAFAVRRAILDEQAARLQTTPDALALAAVLAQPWADVVLSGAGTTDQLRSNYKALKLVWDREAIEKLGTIAEEPDEYWNRRSLLSWN